MQSNTKTYYAKIRKKLKEKGLDASQTLTGDGLLRVWISIRMFTFIKGCKAKATTCRLI